MKRLLITLALITSLVPFCQAADKDSRPGCWEKTKAVLVLGFIALHTSTTNQLQAIKDCPTHDPAAALGGHSLGTPAGKGALNQKPCPASNYRPMPPIHDKKAWERELGFSLEDYEL